MTAFETPPGRNTDAPFAIRAERGSDVAAREALLDACFGANRHARACQRLRDGRLPAEGLAFSAVRQGRVVGTVRLWHVSAGGVPALVLGPLAAAEECDHGAVVLLGDAPYYAPFGFSASKPPGCRCLGRSNATACSVLNCAKAPSTALAG